MVTGCYLCIFNLGTSASIAVDAACIQIADAKKKLSSCIIVSCDNLLKKYPVLFGTDDYVRHTLAMQTLVEIGSQGVSPQISEI